MRACRYPECPTVPLRAHGLCARHHERWVRSGRPESLAEVPPDRPGRGGLRRLVVYVGPDLLQRVHERADAERVSVSRAAELLLDAALLTR